MGTAEMESELTENGFGGDIVENFKTVQCQYHQLLYKEQKWGGEKSHLWIYLLE